MNIQTLVDVMGTLDATHQSSEAAIADFILATLKNSKGLNKKAFLVSAIQAYAKLLQDNGVKVA